MALSAVGALLAAQRRSFWNRLQRESALGGRTALVVSLALVALVLALPGLFAFRLGRELGEELRASADAVALARWNGFQAVFTVGFALLGSLRWKPVFDLERLGHHPLSAFDLLLAEIPAGLFEVFPLLGAGGIVLSYLGLASVMPEHWLALPLLVVQELAGLLALLFFAAAARRLLLRLLARRAALALCLAGGIAVGVVGVGVGWLPHASATLLPGLVELLPGSLGCRGLLALRQGGVAAGGLALGLSSAMSAGALLVAALAQRGERSPRPDGPSRSRREAPPLRFRSPLGAVAALHLRQLLDSRSGRLHLALPALLSALLTGVVLLLRSAQETGGPLPPELAAALAHIASAPVPAWSLEAVVVLGSELWMNQFGWDRGGARVLLQLPIADRDLLRGKLLGLARFQGMQALLALPPLLCLFPLTLQASLHAVAAGSIAFLVLATAGQLFSLRFPRGIERQGAAHLPLHLSWVPSLLSAAVVTVLLGVVETARLVADWAPPLALVVLGLFAAAGYRRALPVLSRELEAQRERLLRI